MNILNRPSFWLTLGTAATVAWGWQATRLRAAGMLDHEPNVFALGSSPYGKTLAIAIQGPVDNYWHQGNDRGSGESGHHDHDHGAVGHVHGESCGPDCGGGRSPQVPSTLMEKAKFHVDHLAEAVAKPNTTKPLTPAHRKYIHRQIEKKLELAYWLDPGNYANFLSLMLFLSESNADKVFRFADNTLHHVERNEKVNPEPWLTAASAANAKLEWYFRLRHETPGARAEFEKSLRDFERCMNRFEFLRARQKNSREWQTIPTNRREVIDERAQFLYKILKSQQFTLANHFSPAP
jgi:hypothetical protein